MLHAYVRLHDALNGGATEPVFTGAATDNEHEARLERDIRAFIFADRLLSVITGRLA